jgi:hypothetical protein
MKRLSRLMILLCLAVLVGSCSNAESPSPPPGAAPDDPATRPARLEAEFQGDYGDTDIRMRARGAVLDFAKTNLSNWTVKGMASQSYYANVFSIDADLEREGRHVVITFDVHKFFPESGDSYWLAVPANKFRQDRQHEFSDDSLFKRFTRAQAELEELRSGKDSQ